MNTAPTPLVVPGPPRPEVPALAAAIRAPLEGFNREGHVGRMVLLDHSVAQDLFDLIEDLCTTAGNHRRCTACGEDVACEVCGIGDLTDWCLHQDLCPACRYANCLHCRGDVA